MTAAAGFDARLEKQYASLRKSLHWSARDGSAEAQTFCTDRYWLKDLA